MLKMALLVICLFNSSVLFASPSTKVAAFIKAYNQHNVDGMLTLVSDDVKWLYNIADELIIETSSKAALSEAMQTHFEQRSHARSEIKQLLSLGPTVVVIEEAFSNNGTNSQCALSVYQTINDLITSVT